MAQRALGQDSLTCPICLDILKDAASLSCGHSYCMDCIQTHWDKEVRYNCPQCRKSFTTRPDLAKNTVLANLVEELRTTGLLVSSVDHCYAGPRDVSCDVCNGRKLKAVSSCLQCLVSYCENHVQPHRDVVKLQRHQLVAPTDNLEETLCYEHNEVKKLFCLTDQKTICFLCSGDKHNGHDTVSAAAEMVQRHKQLENKKSLLQQNLKDTETEHEKLQQEAQDIIRSAQRAVQENRNLFTHLIILLEKRRSEVEQQIRTQEQIQLKHVQVLQDQLQKDITQLKKTISALDTLSLIPEHKQFILLCPSLCTDIDTESRIQVTNRNNFEIITKTVLAFRDKLQIALRETELPKPEPIKREDFITYAQGVTLDQNTAHKQISLSDGNTKATLLSREISYSDHSDRFVKWYEVLSRESLTGRCYWEVEWSGTNAVRIAVSYRDIKRKGERNECGFGENGQSWALACWNNYYCFFFNAVRSSITGLLSSRIGVYLDHTAGVLSFHSVHGQTMTLLHRIQTTFKQPLHVGVWFSDSGDTVHFPKLN